MNVSWASLPIAQREEIRAQRRVEQKRRAARRVHGRRLVRPRCVRRWDEQHQRGGAVRGGAARTAATKARRRKSEDRGARDVQRVEETGVRVGLRGGRRVFGQRRAQIAEARHRDHAKAAARERLGELEPLVEPAARPVHRQERRSLARHGVLDRPAASLRDLAAGCDAVVGAADVAPVARIGQREKRRDEEGGEDQYDSKHVAGGHTSGPIRGTLTGPCALAASGTARTLTAPATNLRRSIIR
jgi:hypothetical protein